MRYHNITKDDMLNGDGLRVVLWVAGCSHCCKDCQNPMTWDPNGGILFDESAKKEIFDQLDKPYISGITFSGGDPLHSANRADVKSLMAEIKVKYPDKTIWLYTGDSWENIMNYKSCSSDNFDYIEESYVDGLYEMRKEIISLCDIVVDGEYIDEKRDLTLKWRGSSNQRVIDVKQTLAKNEIVLYCD